MVEQEAMEFSEIELDMKRSAKSTQEMKFLSFLKWFSQLSFVKQIGLMLSVVFALALSLAIVIWSQTESYDFLFSNELEQQRSVDIIDNLNQLGADYTVEEESGRIKVPNSTKEELKIILADQSFPKKESSGYELLDEESFGSDSKKEAEEIRFQRVLEGEIEKTISSIESVKSTRVLLALPKNSVSGEHGSIASASVIVNLLPESTLNKGQIEAVINLVSSSVPMLNSSQITVVDQKGNMLSSKESSAALYLANKQFEYKKNLEEHLLQRVNKILHPLVEPDSMQTQVSVSVDFKISEKKEESLDLKQEIMGDDGALASGSGLEGLSPQAKLDRGVLRRLSVAVVIDNKKLMEEDGKEIKRPYSEEELDQFKSLVMQAVGFNQQRGDSVIVSNVVFRAQGNSGVSLEPTSLWQQDWVISLVKKSTILLVVSLCLVGVFRFVTKGFVTEQGDDEPRSENQMDNGGGQPFNVNVEGHSLALPTEEVLLLDAPQTYTKRLDYIQKMIDEDSHLVSQVVSDWLKADA